MSGSNVIIGVGPAARQVTFTPCVSSASAISMPMYPAPTTTARFGASRSTACRTAMPSSSVCTP